MEINEEIIKAAEEYYNDLRLMEFAKESNEIEDIKISEAHDIHFKALKKFILVKKVKIEDLETFVKSIEPRAFLRTEESHRIIIGGRSCPLPLQSIPELKQLLKFINNNSIHPWIAHNEYEENHPFMDGNGRSGRALWLWQMIKFYKYDCSHLFLRKYYYQTLNNLSNEDFKKTY